MPSVAIDDPALLEIAVVELRDSFGHTLLVGEVDQLLDVDEYLALLGALGGLVASPASAPARLPAEHGSVLS